jgi:hypothetical protein
VSSLIDLSSVSGFFKGGMPDLASGRDPEQLLQTERTTTVFSGTAEEWTEYLTTDWADRRNHVLDISIRLDLSNRSWEFKANNAESKSWAKRIQSGFDLIRDHLESSPIALDVFYELLFGNPSNFVNELHLHATHPLPSEATREIRFDSNHNPLETDIVLNANVLTEVEQRLSLLNKKTSSEEKLGVFWPVLRRILSQLGYPSYPRDRFKDRITLTARVSFVSIQLLFSGKSSGMLEPNRTGDLYMDYIEKRDGIKKKYLFYHHPYFRMLNDLNFLCNEKYYSSFHDAINVIVRDFLDERYLRISVAGVMPGVLDWMVPMEYRYKKKTKVETPSPVKGKFGILDKEDFSAWKKVEGPLKDAGFMILRQVGMGQFGRVYEALNLKNGKIPQHVAIKVDRIRKGHKKEAIQAVETIMDISRGLSLCPHVIRIHDAGTLKQLKSTYHVLQLVNGDTLDNLIGVTGTEHASVYRPPITRTSVKDLQREYLKVIRSTAGEQWRRDRAALPFTDDLSLSQAMDIMTSTLLWLEEVHGANFAINDLKNGNLMLSRRGQLKGIDLDTYSPVFTPLDKLPDFFFLAITLLMFVLRVFTEGHDENIKASGLLGDMHALDKLLHGIWRFGNLEKATDGRVNSDQIIHWILNIIDQSRNGSFAHEPESFTRTIDELIHLKRNLVNEEMVLD